MLVEAYAGGKIGLGYTYAAPAAARLIHELLAEAVLRIDAMALPAAWHAMNSAVGNLGRPGLTAMAIAAVDGALWDLKAQLLNLPARYLTGCHSSEHPRFAAVAVSRGGMVFVLVRIKIGKMNGRQHSSIAKLNNGL